MFPRVEEAKHTGSHLPDELSNTDEAAAHRWSARWRSSGCGQRRRPAQGRCRSVPGAQRHRLHHPGAGFDVLETARRGRARTTTPSTRCPKRCHPRPSQRRATQPIWRACSTAANTALWVIVCFAHGVSGSPPLESAHAPRAGVWQGV